MIKADGLAAGKGVTVAASVAEAERALEEAFGGAFGAAGSTVVVEECLVGEEASLFALVDGEHVLAFGTAQDHKRVGEGDQGPNTGGMGAFAPAPVHAAGTDRAGDGRDHPAGGRRHGGRGQPLSRRALCRPDADRATGRS